MKIEYDPKYDMMNVEFIADAKIEESVELEDGIIIDYTEDKRIASIEILDVKKRISPEKMESVNFIVTV
ncbi:MAG: DUF2283 domain-containing protein [Methanomicrobia archaeon]|nr:DUF2283 domain-containing protein [Methanomicrobia archaeon]